MANLYDRLARQALTEALKGVSVTLSPARDVDPTGSVSLFCEPDPEQLETILPLGLIRRFLAQGPCAFELVHESPSVERLLASLSEALLRRTPLRWPARPDDPWLWLVCASRPNRTVSALGFQQERGWPRGVYASPPALRMRLVVTNELPRTVQTLLLRLLGAGKPWKGAVVELAEIGPSHPVGALMLPLIVRLHAECRRRAELGNREVEQFLADTRELYDAWSEKLGNRA